MFKEIMSREFFSRHFNKIILSLLFLAKDWWLSLLTQCPYKKHFLNKEVCIFLVVHSYFWVFYFLATEQLLWTVLTCSALCSVSTGCWVQTKCYSFTFPNHILFNTPDIYTGIKPLGNKVTFFLLWRQVIVWLLMPLRSLNIHVKVVHTFSPEAKLKHSYIASTCQSNSLSCNPKRKT